MAQIEFERGARSPTTQMPLKWGERVRRKLDLTQKLKSIASFDAEFYVDVVSEQNHSRHNKIRQAQRLRSR
jgi:hypothetical protein